MGAPETFATKCLIGLVGVYRRALSPLMGPQCRFVPSCSTYAVEALREHGAKALPMIGRRICRCHPFSANEFQYDPVPPSGPKEVK